MQLVCDSYNGHAHNAKLTLTKACYTFSLLHYYMFGKYRIPIYHRSDIGGGWMNSAQLDVTRGTRGEIAKLIGSPSWPAQEHYGCPG